MLTKLIVKLFCDTSPHFYFKAEREERNRLRRKFIEIPDEILDNAISGISYDNDDEDVLRKFVDERVKSGNISSGLAKHPSIFNLVYQISKKYLSESNRYAVCDFQQFSDWHLLSLKIDPDFITTVNFAYSDYYASRKRIDFNWDPIVKCNNNQLFSKLSKSMSENHFHLNNSAPLFQISWLSLMNNIQGRENQFNRLYDTGSKSEANTVNFAMGNMYQYIILAALIRVLLYMEVIECDCHDRHASTDEDKPGKESKLDYLRRIYRDATSRDIKYIDIYSSDIQSRIYTQGIPVHRDKAGTLIDYAFCVDSNDVIQDTNALFSGERQLIYRVLQIMLSEGSDNTKWKGRYLSTLLYQYLIIKSMLRNEIIQTNNNSGFRNFHDYQDRSDLFVAPDSIYKRLIPYTAIKLTRRNQNIKHLEVRIHPGGGIKEKIRNVDNNVKYLDIINSRDINRQSRNMDLIPNDEFFYTIHFLKKKQEFSSALYENTHPRDFNLREELRRYTDEITEIREKDDQFAKRILGIDAANTEFLTRPEVFGQTFRYLKKHIPRQNDWHYSYNKLIKVPDNNDHIVQQLRATYHAGEVFYDIVDGLRTIDEAIFFCNLGNGDRLGHAMALGIDPKFYYGRKQNILIMEKQLVIDNLMWLLKKVEEYNIPIASNIQSNLVGKYKLLCNEVYGEDIDRHLYYQAWKLRGDNPDYYHGKKAMIDMQTNFWDRCALNYPDDHQMDCNRNNNKIIETLKKYHFSYECKKRGLETYEFEVDQYYIELVKEVQYKMQFDIASKGIAIETNPSSNFLISGLKSYKDHPISKWFNCGLDLQVDENRRCPQLNVSINTDNQGVFNICLENEYMILASSLLKQLESDRGSQYTPNAIYEWLDKIRENGNRQSFNNIHR